MQESARHREANDGTDRRRHDRAARTRAPLGLGETTLGGVRAPRSSATGRHVDCVIRDMLSSRLHSASIVGAVAIALHPPVLGAQERGLLAIRQLGPQLAVTTEHLSSVSDIRQLASGNVLINDVDAHRTAVVRRDAPTSTRRRGFDRRHQRRLRRGHRRDHSLSRRTRRSSRTPLLGVAVLRHRSCRYDRASHRTAASQRRPGIPAPFLGGKGGARDAAGRLVYEITGMSAGRVGRGTMSFVTPGLIAARHGLNADGTPSFSTVDSIPVVRVDLATRATDTVGFRIVPRAAPRAPAQVGDLDVDEVDRQQDPPQSRAWRVRRVGAHERRLDRLRARVGLSHRLDQPGWHAKLHPEDGARVAAIDRQRQAVARRFHSCVLPRHHCSK